MGGGLSGPQAPPPVIPYDDAITRLSEEELQRYKEGFQRLIDEQGGDDARQKRGLSRSTFLSSFVQELVPDLPRKLQEVLFKGFARHDEFADYVSLEEFVSGVVLLRHGTPEERLRFLFDALSDHETVREDGPAASFYQVKDLVTALRELNTEDELWLARVDEDPVEALRRRAASDAERQLHERVEKNKNSWRPTVLLGMESTYITSWERQEAVHKRLQVGFTFEELQAWASTHLTVDLLGWIFKLEHRLKLPAPEDELQASIPLQRQKSLATILIQKQVVGTREEANVSLESLQKAFASLRAASESGVVDENALKKTFCPPVSELIVRSLFQALDEKGHGQIDLREFVAGFAVFYHGTWDDKLRWLVSIFDADDDGKVSRDELHQLVTALWRVEDVYESCAPVAGAEAVEDAPPQPHNVTRCTSVISVNRVAELIDDAFDFAKALRRHASDSEPVPDLELLEASDVVQWLHQNSHSAAARFLGRLDSVAAMSLGIKPSDPAQERSMVVDAFAKALRVPAETLFRQDALPQLGSPTIGVPSDVAEPGISPVASIPTTSLRSNASNHVRDPTRSSASRPRQKWQFDVVNSVVGDVWCVVSFRWWEDWCRHVGFGTQANAELPDSEVCAGAPGVIDNSALLLQGSSGLQMRPNSVSFEDVDYVLLPKPVWALLVTWYGGGPAIERHVVQDPDTEELELELYPPMCTVFLVAKNGKPDLHTQTCFLLSEFDSLRQVKAKLRSAFVASKGNAAKAHPKASRLWVQSQRRDGISWIQVMDQGEETLRPVFGELLEREQEGGMQLMLELPLGDGTWPRGGPVLRPVTPAAGPATRPDRVATSSAKTSQLAAHRREGVGMYNLGNTCYMNAATQALFAVRLLREYFVANMHAYDVNEDPNGMGTEGRLACVYGMLMQDMEAIASGPPADCGLNGLFGGRSVAPRRLKNTIGKFYPEFAGFRQQDAQEYMAVVLDFLHEDLNRRWSSKAYIEVKDSGDRPDEEVAQEWWDAHLARNASVVTALFDGQQKSCTVCNRCGFTSARFEPFRFLSIPVPNSDTSWQMDLALTVRFHRNRRWPIAVVMRVPGHTRLKKVLADLAALDPAWELEPGRLICAMVQTRPGGGCYLHHWLTAFTAVGALKPRDREALVVYEVRWASGGDAAEAPSASSAHDASLHPERSPWRDRHTEVPRLAAGADGRASARVYRTEFPRQAERVDSTRPFGRPRSDVSSLLEGVPPRYVLIRVVHRQMVAVEKFFLHQRRLQLMGMLKPFLLCVREDITALDLYFEVWNSVKRAFENFEPVPVARANGRMHDEAAVSSSGSLDWGYRLSRVTVDGGRCSRCTILRGCLGCELVPETAPGAGQGGRGPWLQDGDAIAVDWETSLLRSEHFISSAASYVEEHSSIKEARTKHMVEPPSLADCLEAYEAPETVTAYCSECTKNAGGEFVETEQRKQLSVWGCPPVLLIHLKRFQQNAFGQFEKNDRLVRFPVRDMDFSPFLVPGPSAPPRSSPGMPPTLSRAVPGYTATYDLVGIVNQSGSLQGGHYLACCLDELDSCWRRLNDSMVCALDGADERSIVTSSAYILAYRRKDFLENEIGNFFPREPSATRVDVAKLATAKPRRGIEGRPANCHSSPGDAMDADRGRFAPLWRMCNCSMRCCSSSGRGLSEDQI